MRDPGHCKQIVLELKALYSLSKYSLDVHGDKTELEDAKLIEDSSVPKSFISICKSSLSPFLKWDYRQLKSEYTSYFLTIIIVSEMVGVAGQRSSAFDFGSSFLYLVSFVGITLVLIFFVGKSCETKKVEVVDQKVTDKSSIRNKSTGLSHIVKFFDAYTDPDREAVCLVLEYMDGGSLQSVIDNKVIPSEEDIAVIAYSVLCALRELHARKIIHRDVKPGNILFNSEGIVKLSDFGITRELPPYQLQADTFTGR